jgi:hypothetical protein
MTAPRDPDHLIRAFLDEGEEQLQDQIFDAVRAAIEHKRQRAFAGPWRRPFMSKLVSIGLAAAVVVAIALVGYRLIGGSNVGGPGPTATPVVTPEPSPSPLAAGSFISHGAQIELAAVGEGSSVTGSMTASDVGVGAVGGFTVDLGCTRTSQSGLILIGGVVTDSTNYEDWAPTGSYVAIVLRRGSPVSALLDSGDGATCAAFLEGIPDEGDPAFDPSLMEPIDGTIQLRQ